MPYRRGPPKGSQNRLKHGRYNSASIAQRKLVRQTIRSARVALLEARLESRAPEHRQSPDVDKNT
jgi:hypothetical protein